MDCKKYYFPIYAIKKNTKIIINILIHSDLRTSIWSLLCYDTSNTAPQMMTPTSDEQNRTTKRQRDVRDGIFGRISIAKGHSGYTERKFKHTLLISVALSSLSYGISISHKIIWYSPTKSVVRGAAQLSDKLSSKYSTYAHPLVFKNVLHKLYAALHPESEREIEYFLCL